MVRINIQQTVLQKEFNGTKIDPLFSEILSREYDLNSMSEKEFNLLSIFLWKLESLDKFSFSKKRILDTWNDDYLNFRLNVLKQNIFIKISNDYINTKDKNTLVTSALDQEGLFLFLEEIISLQAMLANKVPLNRKIQLDAIFDLI